MALTKNFSVNTQTTVNIPCNNDCSLSWESATETLIEIENSNTSSWNSFLHKLLSIFELIQLANLLRDSTAVSMDELVPSRFKDLSIVANQLLSHLPLLFIKKPNCQYLVNMHQVELNNPELDSIFQSTKSNDSVPIAAVHVATEFIKASGFKAQEKRRESTITSRGVSLKDIRKHGRHCNTMQR